MGSTIDAPLMDDGTLNINLRVPTSLRTPDGRTIQVIEWSPRVIMGDFVRISVVGYLTTVDGERIYTGSGAP